MNDICVVCGKRMLTKVCECGFDISKNYDSYRTIVVISKKSVSTYKKRLDFEKRKNVHVQPKETNRVFSNTTWQELQSMFGDAPYTRNMTLQERAEAGDAASQYELGNVFYDDFNWKTAYLWYKKASDNGNTDAMYQIGWMYRAGLGVELDEKKAIMWYQKAADKGNIYAKKWLEEYHGNSTDAWYLKEAENGNTRAMHIVAIRYKCGFDGKKPDERAAVYWYQKAADIATGYEKAKNFFDLGQMYCKGSQQIGDDYVKAFDCFVKAAANGSLQALNELGDMYRRGDGVNKDLLSAYGYYKEAAEKGSARAMNQIGSMYMTGNGVTRDLTVAKAWLIRAAENGNDSAKATLRGFFRYEV